MKILVRSLLVVAVALSASAAFAQGDRNGNRGNVCFVDGLGSMPADQFFSSVANASRGGCAGGKLAKQPNSGRLYENGRKVGERLSNTEMKDAIRRIGGGCHVYSCEEIGANGTTSDDFNRNGTPRNGIPVGGGGSAW